VIISVKGLPPIRCTGILIKDATLIDFCRGNPVWHCIVCSKKEPTYRCCAHAPKGICRTCGATCVRLIPPSARKKKPTPVKLL